MVKVSIIVPVYGVEKYLERCVASLLNQTMEDLEIIIVDDKSPDKCPQICDQLAEKDCRIKVIHREVNGGLGEARNSGLEMATGEYISFVDSDDWVDTQLYEKVYWTCQKEGLDICYFRLQRVNDCGDVFTMSCAPCSYEFFEEYGSLKLLLSMLGGDPSQNDERLNVGMSVSVCGGLYKRDVIKKSNAEFTSERDMASEDLVFHVNLLPHVRRVKVLPDVLYNYYVNNQSISTSYNEVKFQRFIRLLEFLRESLPSIFPDGSWKNSYACYLLRTFKVIIRFESRQGSSLWNRFQRIDNICELDICSDLYDSEVVSFLPYKDRLIVFCMKHKLSVFFVFLYKCLYHKYE